MPLLKAPLPDQLEWLTDRVESLVKPAAFLVASAQRRHKDVVEVAKIGSTHQGTPDYPADAGWARAAELLQWDQSPFDGESCYLQLNLEDIPPEIRAQMPALPAVGMVWVTIDLSSREGRWEGTAYFDPRPSQSIPWRARPVGRAQPAAVRIEVAPTLTCATDKTLPEIAWDWKQGGWCDIYDEWFQAHYGGRQPSDIQIGGWMHPIQGDCDELRETLVLAMEDQGFGDCGAIYLHYSTARGFFVHVDTH